MAFAYGGVPMVESIMYLGFGFLTATLVALATVPLVHYRAVRLTVGRLRRMTRFSAAECRAEKDLLRAEFAMKTRRLELRIEELSAKMTRQWIELGRKTTAVNRLKVGLGESPATVLALEARKKALTKELRAVEQALSPTPVLPKVAMFAFVRRRFQRPRHSLMPGLGEQVRALMAGLGEQRRAVTAGLGAQLGHVVRRRRPATAGPAAGSGLALLPFCALEGRIGIAGGHSGDPDRLAGIGDVKYVDSPKIVHDDQQPHDQQMIVVLDEYRREVAEICRLERPDAADGLARGRWSAAPDEGSDQSTLRHPAPGEAFLMTSPHGAVAVVSPN
jgi:hypothetical protein